MIISFVFSLWDCYMGPIWATRIWDPDGTRLHSPYGTRIGMFAGQSRSDILTTYLPTRNIFLFHVWWMALIFSTRMACGVLMSMKGFLSVPWVCLQCVIVVFPVILTDFFRSSLWPWGQMSRSNRLEIFLMATTSTISPFILKVAYIVCNLLAMLNALYDSPRKQKRVSIYS